MSNSGAHSCQERAKQLEQTSGSTVICHCGVELRRIFATLPRGLELTAACLLRKSDGSAVDLQRESISLDKYDSQGNYFDGVFYLSGTLTLSGTVRVEPGNSGDLWLDFGAALASGESVFARGMRTMKIENEENYSKFHVTSKLLQKECSKATTTVVLRGFRIVLEDTDWAGTYPEQIDVRTIGQYKTCSAR